MLLGSETLYNFAALLKHSSSSERAICLKSQTHWAHSALIVQKQQRQPHFKTEQKTCISLSAVRKVFAAYRALESSVSIHACSQSLWLLSFHFQPSLIFSVSSSSGVSRLEVHLNRPMIMVMILDGEETLMQGYGNSQSQVGRISSPCDSLTVAFKWPNQLSY